MAEIPVNKTNNNDELTTTLTNFTKKLVLVTGVYMFGYFGWSIAWIYCAMIVYLVTNRWTDEKRERRNVARAMALGFEKELILTKLNYLPSWVNFPDIERAEWLNRIIRQTWDKVNHYTKDLVFKVIEPNVQKYIKGFKFVRVILGNVPFRIDGVKVYEEQDITRDKIVMDLDISYVGDCRITFQVSGIKGGIENFQMRGRLRVVMKPLISKIPLIGGLQVYFMAEPEIDFDLTGVTQVLEIPGLRHILEKSVLGTINSMFLFPNIFPIKLSNEVDSSEIKIFEPEGVLRVHVMEAKHLMKKDIGLLGNGKSDPYTILTLGPEKIKTPTIDDTVDPKWNFWCEFQAESNSELGIHVWDRDDGSKDETLGHAKVNISNVAKKGADDLWIPLQGVMHGMIHIRLTWLTLSPEISDLDHALKATQLIGPQLHSALLVVYIDSAKNLPEVKPLTPPDSYVVIQVEKNTQETEVVKQNSSPIWEKNFNFMVVNPKTAILEMKIFDRKTSTEIGQLTYKVDNLKNNPDMEFRNQPFILRKSGIDCSVLCSMKLRIFKHEDNILEVAEIDNDKEATSEPSTPKRVLEKQDSRFSIQSRKSESSVAEMEHSKLSENEQTLTKNENLELYMTNNPDEPLTATTCIQLTIRYSMQRQILIVVVHQVANIRLQKASNTPDPYVKLYLLPSKNKDSKRKTKVVKDNCNPIFDETFEYVLSSTDLNSTQLEVTVATEKKVFEIGNNVLGQTVIKLGQYENLSQPLNAWFDLY